MIQPHNHHQNESFHPRRHHIPKQSDHVQQKYNEVRFGLCVGWESERTNDDLFVVSHLSKRRRIAYWFSMKETTSDTSFGRLNTSLSICWKIEHFCCEIAERERA